MSMNEKLTVDECDELFATIQQILSQFTTREQAMCISATMATVEGLGSKENANLNSRRIALEIMSTGVQLTVDETRKSNEVLN